MQRIYQAAGGAGMPEDMRGDAPNSAPSGAEAGCDDLD